MVIDLSIVLPGIISIIAVAIGAIYYHVSTVSKINLLEAEIKDVAYRLSSLENRVETALTKLSDKLDRLVYNIAGKNLEQ